MPWVVLTAFILEYLLQIAGLKSAWLIRRPRRKSRTRPPRPLGPTAAFLLGFFLSLITLAAIFAAYYFVNIWLSLALQALIGAFLLDNRRLFAVSDRIAFFLANNRMKASTTLLSRFVGRNVSRLNAHEMIGLTMNAGKAALPAASIAPLLALALGGAPLMMLVKIVMIFDWKRRDPLSVKPRHALVRMIQGPASWLTRGMLALSAQVMGFVYRQTPVSGIRYMLSDLERNNRHLLITSLIMMIVCVDLLIIARLVISLTGG